MCKRFSKKGPGQLRSGNGGGGGGSRHGQRGKARCHQAQQPWPIPRGSAASTAQSEWTCCWPRQLSPLPQIDQQWARPWSSSSLQLGPSAATTPSSCGHKSSCEGESGWYMIVSTKEGVLGACTTLSPAAPHFVRAWAKACVAWGGRGGGPASHCCDRDHGDPAVRLSLASGPEEGQ